MGEGGTLLVKFQTFGYGLSKTVAGLYVSHKFLLYSVIIVRQKQIKHGIAKYVIVTRIKLTNLSKLYLSGIFDNFHP